MGDSIQTCGQIQESGEKQKAEGSSMYCNRLLKSNQKKINHLRCLKSDDV